MTDSVGVWRNDNGEIESDWGIIHYTRPRADKGEVGPLILVSRDGFDDLLREGPNNRDKPGISTATLQRVGTFSGTGMRKFFHHAYGGGRWTWELFDMHWTDIDAPANCYIGRWPD